MRIIAGKYSKRELAPVGRTRPPLMRIRHMIFDLLEQYYDIADKVVLDLCAGSGSLGLEALSRGAGFAYFFEGNLTAATNLLKVIKKWKIDNAKVIIKDVKYIPNAQNKVDIIFFDPPFGHDYIGTIQSKLIVKNWIHQSSLLIIRSDHEIQEHADWKVEIMRKMGISYVYFCSPK